MAHPMITASLLGCTVLIGTSLTACGGGQVDNAKVVESTSPSEPTVKTLSLTSGYDEALYAAVGAAHADQVLAAADVTVPTETATGEAPAGADPAAPELANPDVPTMKAQAVRTESSSLAAVTTANPNPLTSVERIEQIAGDGSSLPQPISNHWGLHQTRITTHSDGTIRALYLRSVNTTTLQWRLMKRNKATGAWSQEALGLSSDDVTLSRDPVSDVAHVLAWPSSIPTVYTSPGYSAKPVPGTWQVLPGTSRHYGNSGIGDDGTFCLKVSIETATSTPTTNTKMQIACGQHSVVTGKWAWQPPRQQDINLRRTYDYLFPGGAGVASGLIGTSQLDLYKTAAGLGALAPSEGNYVMNGVSFYSTPIDTTSTMQLTDIVRPYVVTSNSQIAPVARQWDAFVDRKSRLLVSYYVNDPLNSAARGTYLSVNDTVGRTLFQGRLTALPAYGYARVFDDAKGRLWLLWTNLGSQSTQVVIYRIQEQGGNFQLSDKTDLSARFAPYAIQGSPYLAVPRGGQRVGTTLDGVMIACDGQFQNAQLADCSPTGANKQRIVHFRLRLPD